MKKLSFLFIFACTLLACNNDDDTIDSCNKATSLLAEDITTTSATINWNDANNASSYFVEYGVSGFSIGSGTILIESDTTADLQNLTPETTYDVYIQVVCSTDNLSMYSDVFSFTTAILPVIPEFRPTLSELNLFTGNLGDLNPTVFAFEYDLNTKLFTDYAHKQRLIALPDGEKMTYNGDGFPLFPDNTVIAKTFYYNNNETDLSQGRNIIETRLLIKINGAWELGNYKWNESQTDAALDIDGAVVPVTWINAEGESQSIGYEIPSSTDCFTCHSNTSETTPIGPRLRTLNFNINGSNQLQTLIDNEMLEGLTDPATVSVLPNWEDTSLGLERRARAYMDINCAHCHIEGGFCDQQSGLRLSYETDFGESNISASSSSILARIQNTIPEYGMPYIGTTILHDEGVSLLVDYINSLE
ncbi:fibronectin type III domain-containing protein [Psychroserpens jangbogonensis]|uniref:fibronectin type III domain-containing protein n=1 Tax=Psychroserpens jangbogonensis TaxID=1484460 RepID=UPI000A87002B|nr:fibronectin type III domain-containing protein [Psychroserpens jangbogonensis]